jgi:5'-phosphate synthase pdxT subunit
MLKIMTHHASRITVGVLALQGDVAEHINVIESLKVESLKVRSVEDLSKCDALIIPGGESTVMMKFLKESGLDQIIIKRASEGMPIFGTCAGAILLSDSHLGLLDISVDRNAYGAQQQSFVDQIAVEGIGTIDATFIRAPIITRTGEEVSVLARHDDHPVLVQQGSIFASTFHPEIGSQLVIHALFLESVVSLKTE